MTSERVADVVEWTVESMSPARRVGAGLANVAAVVDALVRLPTGGGGDVNLSAVRDRRMPSSPAGRIGTVTVNGRAPWIPVPCQGRDVTMHLYVDRAEAAPYPYADARIAVDLTRLTIEGATSPSHGRRRLGDSWQLTLTGEDTDVVMTGDWIDLAWAGHLAGWPEPATSSRCQD